MSELKLLPCPFCGGKVKLMAIAGEPYPPQYEVNLDEVNEQSDDICFVHCPACGANWHIERRIDSFPLDTIRAWNRRARPANEPLTLEQLRKMYDEPVWVVCGIYADWRIPEFIDEGGYKGFIKFTDRSAEPISDYGKNWVAYSRKLGGEQNA
jgi:hypothetical protein